MALNYNKINVSVNGLYIMAESASLSSENPQKPAYILNNSLPYSYIPNNYKASLNLNYIIEISNEPNYLIISNWKNATTGNLNALINIGDIFFTGYLSNYSFGLLPNQTIKAQVTYQIFNPFTGNFQQQNVNDSNLYNTQNTSGIAHYWSTAMTSGGTEISNNNILQLDYSFNSTIEPTYKLGNAYPCQVSCFGAQEEINLINETQNNPSFSGQNYNIIMNGIDNIRLKNLSSIWGDTVNQLDFSVIGFKVQSTKLDISTENLILFSHNLSRGY